MESRNSTRIAKNTIFLYIRMLILMLVSLYTSRVVLETLGVEDYGIYNVVGGIVVLFTFINNAMVTSTQRYLNYEIGRNDFDSTQKVFSISLNIHIVIALLIIILSETIGLWFLNNTIQYPDSRETAVQAIYQLSVLTTCVKIIRAPYNAAIIAYERMSFYAYLSIFEAVLQLTIVYLLKVFTFDRLVMYGILLLGVAVIVNICYYVYCRTNFAICKYVITTDRILYKQLLSFSGWSLFGGVANVGASQGLNMILNVFFGVTVNAAMGIANQVNSAVSSFVTSFQTAFNPQIVKSYASGDKPNFVNLIISTSKYSYFLLFVIAIPIYICCPEILAIWLTEVPEHSISLCRLMLIFSLVETIQSPLWMSVQATGQIKEYQILMACLILTNLPISYALLSLGGNVNVVLLIRCIISVVILVARLFYMKRHMGFPISRFVHEVLIKILPITVVASTVYFVPIPVGSPWQKCFIILSITVALNIFMIYMFGLDKKERTLVNQKLHFVFRKFYRRTQK